MMRSIFVVPSCVLGVSVMILLYRAHPALGVGMLGLMIIVGFARGARRLQ